MSRFRRSLVTAACLAATVSVPASVRLAHAQSIPPSAPPANVQSGAPTIEGNLVAKPGAGHTFIPPRCRTGATASPNVAALQGRGLVVCTDRGRLVLVVLTPDTGFYARYWGKYSLGPFLIRDRVQAWGTLTAGGDELDNTTAVRDLDLQEAFTDSRDFVNAGGTPLHLSVLAASAGGPVRGLIRAFPAHDADVTLCNGQQGTWADITQGMTVEITQSLFNRRVNAYLRTRDVRVVDCR